MGNKPGVLKRLKYNFLIDSLLRRNPVFYTNFYAYLNKVDILPKEALKKSVKSRLTRALKAAKKSAYARENKLTSMDIQEWPLLEKDYIRDNPDKLLTKSKFLTISASTSGSTGIPLKLYRSLRSISYEQATIDFVVKKAGVDLRKSKTGIFRGDSIAPPDKAEPPFWKFVSSDKVVFSSTHLSSSTIRHYYKLIRESKIDVLMGYPSALEELTRHIKEIGYLPNVNAVITSSEVLDSKNRKLFSTVCPNAAVIDYYGLAERMVFAYSVDGNDYYFLPSYAYVELLFNYSDDSYDYYEVVGTSFINNAMPFVRFKTGDLMKVPLGTKRKELNEICLGLKPFSGIIGRTVDYLLTENNEKLVGMTLIPRNVDNIYRVQIHQKSFDYVVIYVIAKPDYSQEDESKLIENARTKIPASITIDVKKVDSLQKAKSGKTPYVLRDF